jgi:cation transport ATPase
MMKRLFKKKGVTKDDTPPAATAAVGVTPVEVEVEVEVGVAPSTSASEKKLSLKSKEKSSSSSAKHDKEHRKKKKEHRSKSKKNDGGKQRSKFIKSLYAFLAFIIFGIWKKIYIYKTVRGKTDMCVCVYVTIIIQGE